MKRGLTLTLFPASSTAATVTTREEREFYFHFTVSDSIRFTSKGAKGGGVGKRRKRNADASRSHAAAAAAVRVAAEVKAEEQSIRLLEVGRWTGSGEWKERWSAWRIIRQNEEKRLIERKYGWGLIFGSRGERKENFLAHIVIQSASRRERETRGDGYLGCWQAISAPHLYPSHHLFCRFAPAYSWHSRGRRLECAV